jgi:hypothetical protein
LSAGRLCDVVHIIIYVYLLYTQDACLWFKPVHHRAECAMLWVVV